MPDIIETLATPAQYLLSNGTRVASEVPVNFYTDSEILKIEVAGGILVIAILVITFSLVMMVNAKYKRWAINRELEERVERGETPDPSEYPPPSPGINRTALFVVGGLVILAGVVFMLMP